MPSVKEKTVKLKIDATKKKIKAAEEEVERLSRRARTANGRRKAASAKKKVEQAQEKPTAYEQVSLEDILNDLEQTVESEREPEGTTTTKETKPKKKTKGNKQGAKKGKGKTNEGQQEQVKPNKDNDQTTVADSKKKPKAKKPKEPKVKEPKKKKPKKTTRKKTGVEDERHTEQQKPDQEQTGTQNVPPTGKRKPEQEPTGIQNVPHDADRQKTPVGVQKGKPVPKDPDKNPPPDRHPDPNRGNNPPPDRHADPDPDKNPPPIDPYILSIAQQAWKIIRSQEDGIVTESDRKKLIAIFTNHPEIVNISYGTAFSTGKPSDQTTFLAEIVTKFKSERTITRTLIDRYAIFARNQSDLDFIGTRHKHYGPYTLPKGMDPEIYRKLVEARYAISLADYMAMPDETFLGRLGTKNPLQTVDDASNCLRMYYGIAESRCPDDDDDEKELFYDELELKDIIIKERTAQLIKLVAAKSKSKGLDDKIQSLIGSLGRGENGI